MLELRPNCECCDRDLPPSSADARICTFECTSCSSCADQILSDICPNCGGNFVPIPIRQAHLLRRAPASTQRVLKPQGCAKQNAQQRGSTITIAASPSPASAGKPARGFQPYLPANCPWPPPPRATDPPSAR